MTTWFKQLRWLNLGQSNGNDCFFWKREWELSDNVGVSVWINDLVCNDMRITVIYGSIKNKEIINRLWAYNLSAAIIYNRWPLIYINNDIPLVD